MDSSTLQSQIDQARKEGYSEEEILQHLKKDAPEGHRAILSADPNSFGLSPQTTQSSQPTGPVMQALGRIGRAAEENALYGAGIGGAGGAAFGSALGPAGTALGAVGGAGTGALTGGIIGAGTQTVRELWPNAPGWVDPAIGVAAGLTPAGAGSLVRTAATNIPRALGHWGGPFAVAELALHGIPHMAASANEVALGLVSGATSLAAAGAHQLWRNPTIRGMISPFIGAVAGTTTRDPMEQNTLAPPAAYAPLP